MYIVRLGKVFCQNQMFYHQAVFYRHQLLLWQFFKKLKTHSLFYLQLLSHDNAWLFLFEQDRNIIMLSLSMLKFQFKIFRSTKKSRASFCNNLGTFCIISIVSKCRQFDDKHTFFQSNACLIHNSSSTS